MLCCKGYGRPTVAATSVNGMRDDRDVRNGIVPNLVPGKGEEFVGLVDDARGLLVLRLAPAVVPFLRLAGRLKPKDFRTRRDRSREARILQVERVGRAVANESRSDDSLDRAWTDGSQLFVESSNVCNVSR